MLSILVADGERSLRNTLKERLEYEGYAVDTAETGKEVFAKLERKPYDVILCDILIQDMDVYDLMDSAHKKNAHLPFIILSNLKGIDAAVNIMRHGAFDYIAKPIDLNKLLASIKESQAMMSELRKTGDLHRPESAAPEEVHPAVGHQTLHMFKSKSDKINIVGESEAILRIKTLIEKVAPSDARVLVTGPNGTGKELVAHSLHHLSPRADQPFVEVNCAAIPSELIESELFGHEKGAFTSAIRQRKGKFEQADGGTLFLDEIGDMSLSAQAKVLRALQEHTISRVGSDKDIEVNVRVIAATNKDLPKEIAAGNFREDLYHRLSVIIIPVPPLKQRLDDIPLLVDFFIDQVCKEYHLPPKSIEPKAIQRLQGLEWSGNIRELRNVVERLIILSGDKIYADDIEAYCMTATL